MATLLEVAAQFKRLFSHIVLPDHNRRIDFTGGCQKVSGGAEKSLALFTGLGEGVSHSRGRPRAGGPDLNSDVHSGRVQTHLNVQLSGHPERRDSSSYNREENFAIITRGFYFYLLKYL